MRVFQFLSPLEAHHTNPVQQAVVLNNVTHFKVVQHISAATSPLKTPTAQDYRWSIDFFVVGKTNPIHYFVESYEKAISEYNVICFQFNGS